jgi:hypothetical protein
LRREGRKDADLRVHAEQELGYLHLWSVESFSLA